MTATKWATDEQMARFSALSALRSYAFKLPDLPRLPLFSSKHGGLLGRFTETQESELSYEEAVTAAYEKHLVELRNFDAYKWLDAQENYRTAIEGLKTRAKQTQNKKYTDRLAEVTLIRAFVHDLQIHEVSELFSAIDTFPTKPELDALILSAEALVKQFRQFSGVGSALQTFDAQRGMEQMLRRAAVIQRTYRKPRADSDVRGSTFAKNIAVRLHREFGQCDPVILAPLCALVGYTPHPTDLQKLARKAISSEEKLAAAAQTT
jgi:hypothetical protein